MRKLSVVAVRNSRALIEDPGFMAFTRTVVMSASLLRGNMSSILII